MKLNDPNINYIIISGYQSDKDDLVNRLFDSRLFDKLIFKDFTVLLMGGSQPSYLAYKDCSNDELRYDAIELMDTFKQSFVICKYIGEVEAKKILFDGRESLLGIVKYEGNADNHNFFIEGNTFSFEPRKRYWIPSEVKHFTEGMIVEIKDNNNQWVEKKVKDPEVEYERMFKLLIKYNKLKVAYKE